MTKKLPVPVGAVFGSWTVLEEVEPRQFPSGCPKRLMRCECKCGRIKDVLLCKLRSGKSTSCLACSRIKHGATKTAVYKTWQDMHHRCYNKNNKQFADYGGRGVHVCERWHRRNPDAFKNFLEDMGPRPSANHSLDKDIIKPGNLCYCPEYCRWATRKEQQRSRRDNRMIEHQGRTQCISAWAEELGMTHEQIKERLKLGWTVEDTLTRPVSPRKRKTA